MVKMIGVILAAGKGERLRPITDHVPKPLLSFKSRPLIDHAISRLMGAGVNRIIVVTGYMAPAVTRHLEENYSQYVDVIHNPNWEVGNATSLLSVREKVNGEDFVLSMCDHLFSERLVRRVIESYQGEPTLCIDRSPRYLKDIADATKVQLDRENYVKAIGKSLSRWNAVDTGLFVLPSKVLDTGGASYSELSDLMRVLAEERLLKAFDATGSRWLDLDTHSDIEYALEAAVWV
jgi:choline kinase